MNFNLRDERRRSTRAIDALREVLPEIRYSDIDTTDEEEIANLARSLSHIKNAVHGRGDGWTEVGPNWSPYNTSPLVNPSPTGFGGQRWRKDFPGGGGQHINDDSDTSKSTRHRSNDDYDDNLKNKKINDQLERARREQHGNGYLVKIDIGLDQRADEELAKSVLGDEAQYGEHTVFLEVDTFEEAVEIERTKKSEGYTVIIEPKGKGE